MKRSNLWKFLPLSAALLSIVLFVSAGGAEKQNKPFKWSLALQNVKTGELVPFSAPIKSETGGQFRLIISPESSCYAYVVAESSNTDDLAVLYAGSIKAGESWTSNVLILSPPKGSESLFVVTSMTEQAGLAKMIDAFNSSPGVTQRRALMGEVMRIRGVVSQNKEAPEKPVLMGATSRGSGSGDGVEFSGLDTYVKTISLEH